MCIRDSLLSQAEHDELASAILVTTSEELADAVSKEVDRFTAQLSRKEIIQKSLDNYGYILIAESMDEAISIANEIASEHLEIQTKNPYDVMTKIRNAGAIFIGEYSCLLYTSLEALKKADRMDLVGYDKHCLIRPKRSEAGKERNYSKADGKQSANGRKKKKTIRNVHKKKTGGRKS